MEQQAGIYLATNLKLLRKRRGNSQEQVASETGMNRSKLNDYENGYIVNPSIDVLLAFSKYYNISIDTLIKVDMLTLSETQLNEIEQGFDSYISGSNLRVLSTTIDTENKENIELVPIKAAAGYTLGYNDPEYISSLPTFQLPFLSEDRKYRAFQINGDSMLPIKSGSYVLGEYMQDWRDIKDGHAYVVLTNDDGAVFKVVYNEFRKKKNLLLKSLNPLYEPYEVNVKEVKEVWKFVNYFSSELPDPALPTDELISTVMRLKEDVEALKRKD